MSSISSNSIRYGKIPSARWLVVFFLACNLIFINSPLLVAFADDAPVDPPPASDTTPPPPPPPSDPAPATVVTGDATSNIDSTTAANTNAATTDGSQTPSDQTPPPPPPDQSQSSSETPPPDQTPPPPPPAPTDTTITGQNDATVGTDATGGAASGGNAAVNAPGDATIVTGDAGAGANVVTAANTNTVNGAVDVVSANSATSGDMDVRPDITDPSAATGTPCTTDGCTQGGSLTVDNTNNATVENTVVLDATTGNNTASTTCGDASIQTGNAYAGANVINLVNTNIINAHLVAITINHFGDWLGDLILPGRTFFEQLSSLLTPPQTQVSNTNDASVTNNVSVGADTGANTATGGANTVISTGDATSVANVANFINTNVLGGGSTSFSILLNIAGSWTGSIFSMPAGAQASFENGHLTIVSDGAGGSGGSGTGSLPGTVSISNDNHASITNNIIVVAGTGGNTENSNCGSAGISTGDALAAANVLNIANTNIIGRNWFIALINIVGNWAGNLAFGRPDLWLGESAALQSPEPVGTGATITYTFTVKNNGDADATGVTLGDAFNSQYLGGADFGGGTEDADGHVTWDLGTIPVGGTVTRSYTVSVSDNLPDGDTTLENTSSVTGHEPDGHLDDNSDSLAVWARNIVRGDPGGNWPPQLVITKTNDASGTVTAPATVHYKVTVKNTGGGAAFNATAHDSLKNPDGDEISSADWDLGEILPGDQVVIEYDMQFATNSPSGVYPNTAYAEGHGGTQDGYVITSPTVTSNVTIDGVSQTSGGGDTGTGGDDNGGAGNQITPGVSRGDVSAFTVSATDLGISELLTAAVPVAPASSFRTSLQLFGGPTPPKEHGLAAMFTTLPPSMNLFLLPLLLFILAIVIWLEREAANLESRGFFGFGKKKDDQ